MVSCYFYFNVTVCLFHLFCPLMVGGVVSSLTIKYYNLEFIVNPSFSTLVGVFSYSIVQ